MVSDGVYQIIIHIGTYMIGFLVRIQNTTNSIQKYLIQKTTVPIKYS